MPHPSHDQLKAFLTNGGDDIAAHLEDCAECRRELDRITRQTEPDWSVLQRPAAVASVKALSALRIVAKSEVANVPSHWSQTRSVKTGTDQPERASIRFENEPGDEPDASALRLSIPGYELLEPLERGGMGRVFKVRQIALNRILALKMLDDDGADADRKARFRTEAEAIAQLQHPSIVQIYAVGEHQGRPFFTMEFASHGTLARAIAGRPQDPRLAADFVRKLADAVQFAHDSRIIHRDIKPANVLLMRVEGRGLRDTGEDAATSSLAPQPSPLSHLQPKLADFGLAKRLGDLRQTRSGVMLGTPGYVAPEQALGLGEIGPAVDVFGLGAVLYEMLTGRPPYLGASWEDTLAALQRDDVASPRLLQPSLPPELELICLKCLRRDPRRRYATANDLSDDLRRFLAGERIHAKPLSLVRRAARWANRHPAATALTILLIALSLGSQAVTAWLWQRTIQQRDFEQAQRIGFAAQAEQARAVAERATKARLDAEERLNEMLSRQVLKVVESQLKLGQRVQARDTLLEVPATLRNARWETLFKLVHPQLFVLSASSPPAFFVHAATFSTNGNLLATAAGMPMGIKGLPDLSGSVKIWDLRTGKVLVTIGNVGTVVCLAFSPDGQRLVTADMTINSDWQGTLREWDVATGKELRTIGERRSYIQIDFSPDGQYLAAKFPMPESLATGIIPARTGPGEIALFEMHTGEQKFFFTAQWTSHFDAAGRRLTTVSGDGLLTHHDLRTGASTTGTQFRPTPFVTPNGEFACYFDDELIRVHSTATDQLQHKLARHANNATCIALSRDSQLLAAPGQDHKIRVWHLPSGEQRAELVGHSAPVLSLTFNSQTTQLASTSADGTCRVWTLEAIP